jgi:hypothetical protein
VGPLPSFLSCPAVLLADVLPGAASGPAAALPGETTLRQALDAGVPARLPLTGQRALVLAVGLGRAREVMDADPSAVVIDLAAGDAGAAADPDRPVARLTLLDGPTLGDTVSVVADVRGTLAVGGVAAFEVVVDALTITAGSLRSPGQYGSSVTLRWRPVGAAPDDGPPPAPGDPSLPRFTVWHWHERIRKERPSYRIHRWRPR